MRASVIALALAGLAIHSPVGGQESSGSLRAFLSAGGGFGSHGTLYASLSLAHRTGDYLVRGAAAFDPEYGSLLVGGTDTDGWRKEVTELALLYGRRIRWGWGWGRTSLGPGYIEVEQPGPVGPGEEQQTSALGLAAQAGVVWVPTRRVGLGLTGVGNFNELRMFAALTLSLHVGSVR